MSFYVIIRGPLGCGKSTIAKRLAKTLDAAYAELDRVLDEHDLTSDKEDGYISQASFIKANGIIALEAGPVLNSGRPMVFDGNFYWRSQIEDLVNRLEFPHYVFTLKASLEVCIARDAGRKKSHGGDAAGAVYAKATEFDYGVVIDVDRTPDACIQDIISHLPKLG